MKQNGKRNIWDNRRVLMVVALLLALLSWIIVAGFINPGDDAPIDGIPIDFTRNQDTYRSRDLQIVSYPPELNASAIVKGNSTVIGGLDDTDLAVYVDYSNVTGPGRFNVRLNIEKLGGGNYTIEEWGVGRDFARTVTMEFAQVATKELRVNATAAGITAAEGYYVGRPQPSLLEVQVSGPESEVSRIVSVEAVVDAEEVSAETRVFTSVPLQFLDAEGNSVDTQNLTVTPGETVDVTVPILQESVLELTVNFTGGPANLDLEWLESLVQMSVGSVRVGGTTAMLESLPEKYSIGTIDVSEIESGKEFAFRLELPSGISNRDNLERVTVSFNTSGIATKTFEAANIRVVNIPRGLSIVPVDDSVPNIVLMGPQEELDLLLPENIQVQIDATSVNLSRGGMQMLPARVVVAKSNRVFAVGTYMVMCEVTADD